MTSKKFNHIGPNRNSRPRNLRLGAEELEDRRLLAADVTPVIDPHVINSIEDFQAVVLQQAIDQPPAPGEIVFLAAGPNPEEVELRATNNAAAADTTNADQLQPGGSLGLDLTGAGYTVGIWDGGHVRDTHQEFGGRITQLDSSGNSNHATHVAGTIGAAGVLADARGMASEVEIRSWDFGNDEDEIRNDAPNINASNHSYGRITGWRRYSDASTAPGGGFVTASGSVDVWWSDYSSSPVEAGNFGVYSGGAADLDEIIYDFPHLVSVWSAGNDRNDAFLNSSDDNSFVTFFSEDPGGIGWSGEGWYLVNNGGNTTAPPSDGNGGTGYDSLSTTHTAKNTIVVGAIQDLTNDPYDPSDITVSSFTSFGSTDDGRIKPDLVGNGVSLFSSTAAADDDYSNFSGTSMSAPNVTGSAVLLMEHFNNEFGFNPLAATTKALLIHTAADAGNVGPDYAHGWGLVDVARAADLVSEAGSLDSGSSVQQLNYADQAISQQISSDGTSPLKVTVAWTDPAGVPVAFALDDPTPMLVNDLDLTITGPDGTHFPWTLDVTSPADPAERTTSNHVDNVEQVLIDAPIAGNYTVSIGSTGSVVDQDFSIVIDGATPFAITCDLTGDGACDGTDIDELQANIVFGPADPASFDLTGDGLVTSQDRDQWLALAGAENLPSGNAYLIGDSNLDGIVDGLDFIEWNANKFTSTSDWTAGDFTVDGVVDGLDFIEWNNFKFQSADIFAGAYSQFEAEDAGEDEDEDESRRRRVDYLFAALK